MSESQNVRWSFENSSSCHSTDEGGRTLTVRVATGKILAFPWAHFIGAECRTEVAWETLQITFSSAEIVIEGTGLKPVWNAIARFRLASVCVLPAEERATTRDYAPIVERITVRTSGASAGIDR
jgi:hypothetical protein